jgi:NAD(P)-dependent dehydrogenase (short-subunit alcohol dehydrogenase family)
MTTKTILITGSTSGIGKAAALGLARRGYTVFASGRRADALEQLRTESEGTNLIPIQLDVANPASIEEAAVQIRQQTGGHGIDVLINNAGYAVFGPLLDLDDATMRRQFDVNVFGLMAVTRTFATTMMARRSGRIINISSIGGRMVFPFDGIYHATKFAVEALSDALRMELAPFGIRVVLIEPGTIRTGFLEAADRSSAQTHSPDSPFRNHMEVFNTTAEELYRYAPGPDVVVRAIIKAIESRRPKARYTVPWRDRLALLLHQHIIPTWVVDMFFIKLIEHNLKDEGRSGQQTAPSYQQ